MTQTPEQCEARLDETLTRREVIESLEFVAQQYSPHHDTITIELLTRLIRALS